MRSDRIVARIGTLMVCLLGAVWMFGQASGTVRGTVIMAGEGSPIHGVSVQILELQLMADTDENGQYQLARSPREPIRS